VRSAKKKNDVVKMAQSAATSPFAPLEMQIVANRVKGAFFIFDLIRSGISPGPNDPKAGYDRAIRTIGGVMILLALSFGLLVAILDAFHKRF